MKDGSPSKVSDKKTLASRQGHVAGGITESVMTVLGPIPAHKLGVTLLHEHLIVDARIDTNDPNKLLDDAGAAVEEMNEFQAKGGTSLVDQTCRGLGQNIVLLKDIAARCHINIIAATGFYRLPTYPAYVATETAEQLAQRMIQDVVQGIEPTESKAGILGEIGTEVDKPFTQLQKKVYTAVSMAQQATGLSIMAHCWVGHGAIPLIELLTGLGVSSERIVIQHIGANRTPIDVALGILDRGAKVMVDCVGYLGGEAEGFTDWDDSNRATLVVDLFERGYRGQVTVSNDLCRRNQLLKYGGQGYSHLLTGFVPLLCRYGLSDKDLHRLLVDNPREVLVPKHTV